MFFMLSVIIIAKNEEMNIRRCLESVSFADEIIVLDSGSTDATVAVAEEYTSKVFSTDWQGYGIQKQRALSRATGDWVLNLDADESLSLSLQKEIQSVITDNKADAFRIPIQMNFYNQPLKYSSSPQRHIRLFKKIKANYSEDIVHEKIILTPESHVLKLKHSINHHSFKDLSHALYKMNKYSSYSAKIRISSEKNPSVTKIMMSTTWMFLRCYLLQGGFLDGQIGFLFATYNAQGTFYRGMKQLYRDVHIDTLPQITTSKEDEVF